MTITDLNLLFDRLGTPPEGRRLVEKARRESPVRDIKSNSGNVITLYASKKMGRDMHIGTESRTVEFPAVIQYEHDSHVIEYYPQPCYLDLILPINGGAQKTRIQHAPDFLIIRDDQILIEEWRQEKRLEKLASKYPGRFVKENGEWRFPAVEEFLSDRGITYRLRSSDEHPRQYVSNLEFLSDYYSPSCIPVDQKKIDLIHDILAENAVATIGELLKYSACGKDAIAAEDEHDVDPSARVSADDIYKAIVDGHIAFDIMNDDISETDSARVYRDKTTLAFYQRIEDSRDDDETSRLDVSFTVGTEVNYDGKTYTIALVGQKSVMLSADDGTTELSLEVLEKQYAAGKLSIISPNREITTESPASLSPKEMDWALRRAQQLEYSDTAPELVTVSKRTLQRYRQAIREAGENVLDQNMALVPNYENCGNRERKIPQILIDIIKSIVVNKFNTATNINKKMAYTLVLEACQSAGVKVCSQKTCNKEIDRLTSVRKRKGKRSHYQLQPIVWYLKLDEHIHGVRPFQYVHFDHTPLEILLCSPNLKRSKWTVWLSLAIDAESRNVVGFYLSFEQASYKSCMMLLRDIVRRHGRMPDMIVVDNGKEFKSRAFKRVCRLYGCSIRYRPAGEPRHGAVIERLFGITQSQLIHNLSGNTQLRKHLRMITKSVNPKNFVEWTLPALHGALDFYFEKLYGTENHPAHGEEPVKHFLRRMAETGMRLHRIVRFDRTFRIETCPAPDATGSRVVDGQRGVKINNIWYWNNTLSTAGLHKKPVEIRIDPWDVRYVYALVNNEWQQCESKLVWRLRRLSRIELRYAFDELAKKHNVKKKELSPERVADWLRVMDAKNFDERLREQHREALIVYGHLGMMAIENIETQDQKNSANSSGIQLPSLSKPALSLAQSCSANTPEEEESEYGLF